MGATLDRNCQLFFKAANVLRLRFVSALEKLPIPRGSWAYRFPDHSQWLTEKNPRLTPV